MKTIQFKALILSCIVCLLPILFGLAFWNELPHTMAIHFNINNEPDNFASKGLVVFGLPVFMAIVQLLCFVLTDIGMKKHGEQKKFERVVKWIIPCMTVILQIVTIGYGLGWGIDIRRVAVMLVGIMYIVMGNYIPKLNYVKNIRMKEEEAKKYNRFSGFSMVIMGIVFLISLLFSANVSAWCLVLMVPYVIVSNIIAIVLARK